MLTAVPYKKISYILLLVGAALAVWALPSFASAQSAIGNAVAQVLWTIVNTVFGFFLGLAGGLLDSGVSRYVVGFGDMYRNSGLGFSIDSLWSTVRDIFNLTFIFGLVFIGFKMIFNTSDSSARRMLVSLVLAALLVNFSLFITKFIIDFSNIAATQFAQAFNVGGTYSVSQSFMNLFGLSSALDHLPTTGAFTYIFGMLFLYIIAIFVFAAGGLLLIIRFVVLNIYMVLSPVMFLGWVFPGLSGASRAYWQGFLGRAFFAPAYILMLYFANQILVNMQGVATNGANLASAFADGSQYNASLTIIPFFVIIAGFLIAALVVAQKMGVEGASSAIALGRRMTGRARKIAVGGAGYLPRIGVNYVGEKSQKRIKNLQAKDFKNSGVFAGAAGAIARTNLADRALYGSATAMAGAKFGTGTTNAAERAYKQKTVSRANQTEAENNRSSSYSTNLKALSDNTKSADQLGTALDDLAKAIKGMSKDEKNNLDLKDLTNKSVAVNLSDDDIKNLDASGNFSAAEIQQIKDARKQGFIAIAKGGSTLANVDATGNVTDFGDTKAGIVDPVTKAVTIDPKTNKRKALASRSAKEVGSMPIELFKQIEMYDEISPAMLEERIKSGVDPADYPAIRLAIENHLGVAPGTDPKAYPTALDSNRWVKWIRSNSVHASNIF